LDFLVQRHPDIHHYRCNLAVSLVNFSNFVREKLNKATDAEPPINQAVKILSKLAEDYPRIPLYRKELANAYNSLANQFAHSGNYSDAGDQFRKSLNLFEQLLREHRDNAEYQSLTGMTLGGLAWLADVQKDHAQAVQLAQQAVEHQQIAFDLHARHPLYRKRLDGHINFLKDVKARLGRTDTLKK
jgi:tetratricopeptide (TPR) repeat protein